VCAQVNETLSLRALAKSLISAGTSVKKGSKKGFGVAKKSFLRNLQKRSSGISRLDKKSERLDGSAASKLEAKPRINRYSN